MPLIPSPTPLVDGTAVSSEAVDEVLYRPLATPVNFEVLNGRLDSVNAPGVDVSSSMVQSGAFTLSEQVGATGHNDYFYNLYSGVKMPQIGGAIAPGIADVDNVTGATRSTYLLEDSQYQLIPGAGKTFYLPRTSNVLLFWHVETEALNQKYGVVASPQVNDPGAQDEALSLKLFLDGQHVVGEKRQFKVTDLNVSGTAITSDEAKFFRRKWSGHCIVQLAAGWHNAGIGIAHQVYHVRTTTKRFGYVALRA